MHTHTHTHTHTPTHPHTHTPHTPPTPLSDAEGLPNADAHPLRPDAKGLPDANPMSRPGTSLMSKRPSSSDPDGLTSPQTLTGRGPGHATMPGIRDCLTALLPGGEGRPGLSYRMFGIHTHTHTPPVFAGRERFVQLVQDSDQCAQERPAHALLAMNKE